MKGNMEDENLNESKSDNRLSDTLLDAYSDRKLKQENIDSIKNRKGKNEAINPSLGDDESSNANSKPSSLEEKEELNKKEKIDNVKNKIDDNNGTFDVRNTINNITGINDLKKKWIKAKIEIKIALSAVLVLAAMVVVLFIFTSISTLLETFTNAITNFFVIREEDTSKGADDGLYTSDKYLVDKDGNELTHEELVEKLKEENSCSNTGWDSVVDWLTGSGFNGDQCKFLRYVKNRSGQTNGADVDPSLIISTIFYGYDTQPNNVQYNNPNNIPADKIESTNHYDVLKQVLTDNKTINKAKVDEIIDNSVVTVTQTYYQWVVTEDEETGEKTGRCEARQRSEKYYSLDKWKIFMRYGAQRAKEYDDYLDSSYLRESSSEECNGSISDADLTARLQSASQDDSGKTNTSVSVDTSAARNAIGTTNTLSSGINCYADVNSKTIDDCPYSYKDGFAYNNFLGYAPAINDPTNNVEYDEIFTPKYIETTIQDIIEKKKYINEFLLFDDPDSNDTMGSVIGPVTVGAYCKDYIKTPLSNIRVQLTDCHGVKLDTVSFEDYIIGVANAEVSNKNDNYVLSEMLAAISYALKRRNNYTKGDTIVMKSGTCDQAYCSPRQGCTVKKNPEICSGCMSFYIGGSRGKSEKIYNKYKQLYSIASQFLVVSNGKVHNAHYVSTIQNEWYKKASEGMSFTQIISETYKNEGAQVVKCSTGDVAQNTPVVHAVTTGRVGDKATSEYPKVSNDKGIFYGYSYVNKGNNNISINPLWIKENIVTISPTCSNNEFANMDFRVHKDALNNFNRAFRNICTLLTEGVRLSNGSVCKFTMSNLKGGTVFTEKQSANGFDDLHSYGIAQDWNYSSVYNINGVNYKPYSSSATLEDYWNFVEAINKKSGNKDIYDEENCSNINYILYKYAYEPAGFSWGYGHLGRLNDSGSYVTGSFNGKTFIIDY